VFAYAFPIFTDADLKVYKGSTLMTLSSNSDTVSYQVSGAGTSAGGNVTFGAGLTAGDIVTIYRDLAVSRASDYQTGGDLLAETLNDDLDKLVMMVQQQERDIANRSIRFGQFVTGLPLNEITDNAADRANKVVGFDSTGQPTATTEIGNFKGNWAASTAYVTRDIIKDTSNNNIYIANTSHTSSGSQPISGNTDSGKWDLLVDAASATTSQTAAATSATAAATSATASATSATASATSATASASSATTATTQATNSSNSATAAAASATSADNAASAVGAKYTFDNSTSMADPGTGDFRFNNATVGSVTAVSFDATSADTGNPDLSDFIATWDDSTSTINGHLIFKKSGTPATFAIFTVGAVTDNTGWLQVAVTHVDSNGSWSNADGAYVQFVRNGDKGDTGSTGSTGATGPRGSDAGLDMTFESTTTDTDQGVGKIWFNHGTLASATVLYMDDVDANSASINSLVDSWDDSTTTALRGTIKVTQKASNAIFAIYNVTGAVVSASTYSKVPVTYVTGAGSFTDADASTVMFSRTGNTGSAGSSTPADDVFRIQDNSDNTKQIAFEASSIASGTTRTITVPNSNVTLVSSGSIASADLADSAFLANRNYIINGDFDVWQRGTSFTISSAGPGTYTADRWKLEGNNFSGSLTRQSFATNQTDVPNCPAYYARWINTTTMPSGQKVQFLQPIELKPNGFKLANQEVTFSCWLKSVSGTIPDGNIKLIKESAVYPSVGAIGTTWTKFTHTWTVWNSNQGYMWIGFECPATYSLTNGLDIAHCQLEIGDTATPFEHKTYAQELFACQRYWQRVKENWWAYATSASVIDSFVQFIPDMRAAPSVTLDDNTPTFQKVNVANVTGSSSSITASSLNTTRGFVRIDGFSGLTSNSDYLLVSTPFYFDAEL